ncbi:helix-turn-helix transcriptional regulator (plasmid) [Bacillus sp. F19]|nr:helix-turn-helix transcriptional regulator [Bacillus sp. F19]
MRKGKFFWKLFSSFIIIIIIYTLVSVFIFNFKNSQIAENERRSKYKTMIMQTKEQIDRTMEMALLQLIQIESNHEFIQYTKNTDENPDYYDISRVYNLLQQDITSFSNYEYKISIYKNKTGLVITPNATMSYHQFLSNLKLPNKEQKKLDQYLEKTKINYRNQEALVLPNEHPKDSFTIIKKELLDTNKDVVFFVTFNTKGYFPYSELNNNDSFSIFYDKNHIFNSSNTTYPKNILNKVSKELEEYQYIENKENQYHLIPSDTINEINYAIKSPVVENGIIHPHSITSLLFLLVILLTVGFVLSFMFISRSYHPIKKIAEMFSSHPEKDELSHIEKSIYNLKNTNEKLIEIIQTNEQSLRNNFIRELLMGILTCQKADYFIRKYDVTVLMKPFRIIIFELDFQRELHDTTFQERYTVLKVKAISYLKDLYSNHSDFEIVELSNNRFVLLMCDQGLSDMKELIQSYILEMEKTLKLPVIASIGTSVNTIEKIETDFQNTLELLEYKFSIEKKTIIAKEDVQHLVESNYYYPLDLEREFIYFSISAKEKAEKIIDLLIKENLYERKLHQDTLTYFVAALDSTIQRILQSRNERIENHDKHKLFISHELSRLDNKETLEIIIRDKFNQLFDIITIGKEKESSTMTEKLVQYIYDNYEKDISLNDLAENFNLSSSYISTLFKTHIGQNFKEFLNRYRIEKSKEMFKNHHFKVHQVSEMVGFNNVQTFIRLFKKYTGISPGQYNE